MESETGRIITIKTATNVPELDFEVSDEPKVVAVQERLVDPHNGSVTFKTLWQGGDVTYEPSSSFIDDDGATTMLLHHSSILVTGVYNIYWVEKATKNDIKDAFRPLKVANLSRIQENFGIRVPDHLLSSELTKEENGTK